MRESSNSENTTAVAATINGKSFANNIDFSGKADPQQQVEWMRELFDVPEEERVERGKQLANLFAADEILAKMTALHAKHKTGDTKDRAAVAKWGMFYAMASRWEACFLFMGRGGCRRSRT